MTKKKWLALTTIFALLTIGIYAFFSRKGTEKSSEAPSEPQPRIELKNAPGGPKDIQWPNGNKVVPSKKKVGAKKKFKRKKQFAQKSKKGAIRRNVTPKNKVNAKKKSEN